ncbi:MAG: hypothetical protein RLZZ157_1384 [Pseudomonadota bacterium]
MGLTNRVKARAARSAAVTRLLKPALKSEQRPTDTQQSIQHFGIGTAVTKVRSKPLLLCGLSTVVYPKVEGQWGARSDCVSVKLRLVVLCDNFPCDGVEVEE